MVFVGKTYKVGGEVLGHIYCYCTKLGIYVPPYSLPLSFKDKY